MILIITDSIPTKSFQRSGIFGYDDFRFFKKEGYDVKLIALNRITYERRFLFNFKKQLDLIRRQMKEIRGTVKNNPDIEFISYFSMIKPFVFKEDLFLFRKSKFKNLEFDFIIVHNMVHTGLNINWIRKQFPHTKVYLKEHDNWLLHPKLVQYFALRLIHKYDKILANSCATKESFLKIFEGYKNRTKKLPDLQIDYPKFHINTRNIEKSRTGNLQILTVANLIKEKGFEECFSILNILEDAKISWFWTIIGKGGFLQNITNLANQYNFTNKISILPEVQKPFLFEFMKKSNVYLQLSYVETFGIAPIEAFSYFNKLIISNSISSINELGLANKRSVLIIEDINNALAQEKQIIDFVSKDLSFEEIERVIRELDNKINTF